MNTEQHLGDEDLRRSAPDLSLEARTLACDLSREVRAELAGAVPLRRRRRWTRGVAAGAIAGVLALTGAGSLAAYQLSIPPFTTLESGVGRAHTGITVDYTNSLGREVDCLAFIEYRNLTADQAAAVDDLARDDRWDGYGQRVLDRLGIADADPEQQNAAVAEVVSRDLWVAARDVVPGMVHMRDSDGPVFAGDTLSCAGPGGVDGRP